MNTSAQTSTPKALRAWVTNGKVWIELEDGREIGFPTEKFPRLKGASADDLAKVRIEARGKALRWEELDEDLSINGLLAAPPASRPLGTEAAQLIYVQAAESHRYQDSLKWSRVKTVAIIEGALFYVYSELDTKLEFQKGALIVGTVLIGIVAVLACLDKRNATYHLERMRVYENQCQFGVSSTHPVGLGTRLLMYGLILLVGANVVMLIDLFRP